MIICVLIVNQGFSMALYFSCNNRGYYVWQKSHYGRLIRLDLRTRDFQIASNRSKILLSSYIRLKNKKYEFHQIRECLLLDRDTYIESEIHLEAGFIHWMNTNGKVNRELDTQQEIKKQGHKLSLVAEEWYNEMEADWRPLTYKSNKGAVDLFISWYGDCDIESFDKLSISKFKNTLKNRYKSDTSRQSMFKKISALFNFATVKRDYLSKNPFLGMGFKKVKNLRAKTLIPLELHNRVLDSVEYKSNVWWLLQILYYTGMRITETIQLTIDDYVYITDRNQKVACISVNSKDGKRVKSISSVRNIPIHKDLISLGIMELLPTFPWNVHNPASRIVSKVFKNLNEQHTAHDYRYSLSDRLRDVPELPDHVRFSILGHSSNTMTDAVYRSKEPILLMKQAIDVT